VAFYVPLGPRGLLFRLGTFVIGIWGGLVYQLAYHRRAIILSKPEPFPSIELGAGIYASLEETSSLPSTPAWMPTDKKGLTISPYKKSYLYTLGVRSRLYSTIVPGDRLRLPEYTLQTLTPQPGDARFCHIVTGGDE
jgi:hypothetical protein